MEEALKSELTPAPEEPSSHGENESVSDGREALERANQELSAELEKLKAEQKRSEEEARARENLRRLVGQGGEELYEEVLRYAGQKEELAALPPEKRCEFAYFLYLGEQAERQRRFEAPTPERTPGPRFAHSDGGAYHASVLQTPTTFEMAKENAKKYFGI